VQSGSTLQAEVVVGSSFRGSGGETWPVVFGVLSLVVAFIDLAIVATNAVYATTAPGDSAYNMGRAIGGSIIPGILALWLLFAAIGIIRRSPGAISLIKQWAWVKLVLTVVCNGVGIVALLAVQGAAERIGAGAGGGVGTEVLLIAIVIGAAWGLAWPIVSLIWLSQGKVQADFAKW